MSASLKDVAREAGLSSAAMSRHLNGTLELPAETRDRIDHAVHKLGYRPNPHARRLSLGWSDTITLIVPDIADPFFATLAAAVERPASKRGLIVQLHATSNLEEREIAVLELAADNRSNGVVFCTNCRPGARRGRGDRGAAPCGARGRGRSMCLRAADLRRQRSGRLPCRTPPGILGASPAPRLASECYRGAEKSKSTSDYPTRQRRLKKWLPR